MPETLDYIELEKKYVKPLEEEDKPSYTECEKRIIAWSIAWEGTLSINRTGETYLPIIAVSNTDFELLANFAKICKLGCTYPMKPQEVQHSEKKVLTIRRYHEVLFILQNLKGYMPCEKYRKLRDLVSEFCQSRIHKNENNLPLHYDERELEIIRQVRKLNKKGRKK